VDRRGRRITGAGRWTVEPKGANFTYVVYGDVRSAGWRFVASPSRKAAVGRPENPERSLGFRASRQSLGHEQAVCVTGECFVEARR
jgi:hypothetical protein